MMKGLRDLYLSYNVKLHAIKIHLKIINCKRKSIINLRILYFNILVVEEITLLKLSNTKILIKANQALKIKRVKL